MIKSIAKFSDVLRVLCVPLSFTSAMFNGAILTQLQGVNLPWDIPYRGDIYFSEALNGSTSIAFIIWIFLTLYPIGYGNRHHPNLWYFLLLLVDITLSALTLYGIVVRRTYLPETLAGCAEATTWQLSKTGTNLFTSLADNGMCGIPPCTAQGICHNFVVGWTLSIAVLSLFILTYYTFLSRTPVPWPMLWIGDHFRAAALNRARYVIRPRSTILPQPYLHEHSELESFPNVTTLVDIFTSTDPPPLHFNDLEKTDPCPASPKPNRIFRSVAKNLHYTEVLALSMVSKAMHSAIFLSQKSHQYDGEKSNLIPILRACTCTDGLKKDCWCCGVQICEECKQILNLHEAPSATHLKNCHPYCSTCFYRHVCQRVILGTVERERRCDCMSDDSPEDSRNYYSYISSTPRTRNVCSQCGSLTKAEALKARERREMRELAFLTKMQMLRCKKCQRGLGKETPRWWGCAVCQMDCAAAARFHIGLDKRRD